MSFVPFCFVDFQVSKLLTFFDTIFGSECWNKETRNLCQCTLNYAGVPLTGVFNALLSVNVTHNQYLCCLATGEQKQDKNKNLYKQKHGASEYFRFYVDCGTDIMSRSRFVDFIFIIFAVSSFVKLVFSKLCDPLQITNVDHTRITMNFERFEKTQISAGTFKFVPKLVDPSQTFTFLNFITAIV